MVINDLTSIFPVYCSRFCYTHAIFRTIDHFRCTAIRTLKLNFQHGVQSAEAFSYIHFSLFWTTNIAKGRENFPAFIPNYLEPN